MGATAEQRADDAHNQHLNSAVVKKNIAPQPAAAGRSTPAKTAAEPLFTDTPGS